MLTTCFALAEGGVCFVVQAARGVMRDFEGGDNSPIILSPFFTLESGALSVY
jgi:hypothetical protein